MKKSGIHVEREALVRCLSITQLDGAAYREWNWHHQLIDACGNLKVVKLLDNEFVDRDDCYIAWFDHFVRKSADKWRRPHLSEPTFTYCSPAVLTMKDDLLVFHTQTSIYTYRILDDEELRKIDADTSNERAPEWSKERDRAYDDIFYE